MADRTRNDFPSTSPNGFYFGPNGQAFPLETGGVPSGFYFNPQTGRIEPLSTGGMGGSTQQSNPFTTAPTQAQVNANPSQYAGTSFDPSRYLTYPGSLYGNGTGNGNPNTGMFASQGGGRGNYPQEPGQVGDTYAGPRPDPTKTYGNGYWNAQNDPQGFNHNIYAPFLSQNTDISTPQGQLANILSQMLTSGEGPMRQAQQWLQQNVRPGATSMNPGADGSAIMRSWGQLNGSSPNGNATPGVPNLGNGINPLTGGTPPPANTQQQTPPPSGTQTPPPTPTLTQGQASANGVFPTPSGITVNNGQNIGTPPGPVNTGQGRFDSYNSGLDALTRAILGLPASSQITDAQRRQARLPSRAELQMNQQYWQQNPSTSLDSSMFGGNVPTLNDTNFNAGTDIGYLPTGAAPQNFTYQWMDPDAAGANPGNWGLNFGGSINDYAGYQNLLSSVVNNSAYGNKGLNFGKYNDMFYNQNGGLNTQGLSQNDFQRLMSMANSPFFGTPLGGGSALGNYIQSQGSGAVNAALGQKNASGSTAFDPGVDGTGMSASQLAPVNRDFTTYPGSGVAGGNNSLTMNANSQPPPTPTPTTTTTTTGDGRPPKFNDSAYYPSTL